jgi:hypothetical protein
MSPAGALIIATLLGGSWATGVVAYWYGRRKDRKDSQAIAKNPQKYLKDNLGNGIGGRLYRGASGVDDAIERATRPAEDFLGMVNCPNCNAFGYHHIHKVSKRFVWRECINERCQKKWKQAK